MESLSVDVLPDLTGPYLLLAFRGWPDAAEGASGAIRYLVKKLGATKFAEIDPEEFFDFTTVRPMTSIRSPYQREVKWPSNRFYYYRGDQSSRRDLVFFLGVEPSLRWKTYANLIVDLAQKCAVEMFIALGALMDSLPHTRETKLSGSANRLELVAKLESLGVRSSNYQGPTGIHSAVYEACQKRSMPMMSLWGHSPSYVQGLSNPKVSHALLAKLKELLRLELDLDDLAVAAATFQEELSKILVAQPELQSYVKNLEEQYDQEGAGFDAPSREDVVRELEDFLRKQRKDEEER
ncbi:MAG: PAC2 family protein [Chloroflexi bacterium]|nr:PAC2 family protein [Chloroflexota bacterium]